MISISFCLWLGGAELYSDEISHEPTSNQETGRQATPKKETLVFEVSVPVLNDDPLSLGRTDPFMHLYKSKVTG